MSRIWWIAGGVVAVLAWSYRYEAGELTLDTIYGAPGGDIDTLARTLWGEARGEGVAGMEAVAAVVMNRVRLDLHGDRRPDWWGEGVEAVCRKPWQFSCWNPTDPNAAKIRALQPGQDFMFDRALDVAARAVAGKLPDPTGGATHYHASGVSPDWARSYRYLKRIGGHLFYRSTDRGVPALVGV